MKVLVRGNLVVGSIASVKSNNFDDLHKIVDGNDADYDLVIYGDMKVTNLMLNGAEVYITGDIITLEKE